MSISVFNDRPEGEEKVDLNGKSPASIQQFYYKIPKTIVATNEFDLMKKLSDNSRVQEYDSEDVIKTQLNKYEPGVFHEKGTCSKSN